jgi:DNA phosphorothioation-dependent restriction protein DptG
MSHDPVQAQLDAYNAHDVDAFAACYATDVKIFDATGALVMEGLDALRARYGMLFAASPQLHAEVTQRTRIGTAAAWYVVDTERVSGRQEPGAPARFDVLVLYAGRGPHIHEVRFLTPRVMPAD